LQHGESQLGWPQRLSAGLHALSVASPLLVADNPERQTVLGGRWFLFCPGKTAFLIRIDQ